jgi:4-oxalocrotonate tautomerase
MIHSIASALAERLQSRACGRQESSRSYTASPQILISDANPGAKEGMMPLVQVKVIKGVFDSSQKQDMITQLTETMVGIEGEALRGVTWVTIDEVESGDWGIGGNAITAQYVKDLQRTPAVAQ